ncbi:RNA-binding domain-containing protein [Backusella circina FSU 941]|nr:RNA-binding domain-containing protein [Backusella circina FSU 941]
MSYYGDRDRGRANPCRLYVGKVSRHVREGDLRDLFSRYGRLRDLSLKNYYAFIEYDNVRDADDAIKYLDGYRLEDERLIVQVAKRSTRDLDRDRDYGRDRQRDNNSGGASDRCYNCGEFGIAKECSLPKGSGERAMRFQNGRCFECGNTGHRARDCPERNGSSPPRRRYRSRSRSPVRRRSRSPRSRRYSPRRRSRSNSRHHSPSRSPRDSPPRRRRSDSRDDAPPPPPPLADDDDMRN